MTHIYNVETSYSIALIMTVCTFYGRRLTAQIDIEQYIILFTFIRNIDSQDLQFYNTFCFIVFCLYTEIINLIGEGEGEGEGGARNRHNYMQLQQSCFDTLNNMLVKISLLKS